MFTLDLYPLMFGLALTLQETQLGTSERRAKEKKLIAACKEPKVGKAIIRVLRRLYSLAVRLNRDEYILSVLCVRDLIQDGYNEKEMLDLMKNCAYWGTLDVINSARTELTFKKRREASK